MPLALQDYIGIVPACYTFQSYSPQTMHGDNALHCYSQSQGIITATAHMKKAKHNSLDYCLRSSNGMSDIKLSASHQLNIKKIFNGILKYNDGYVKF